jgi:hypothetical protein
MQAFAGTFVWFLEQQDFDNSHSFFLIVVAGVRLITHPINQEETFLHILASLANVMQQADYGSNLVLLLRWRFLAGQMVAC